MPYNCLSFLCSHRFLPLPAETYLVAPTLGDSIVKVPRRFLRFLLLTCAGFPLALAVAQMHPAGSPDSNPTALRASLEAPSLDSKVENLLRKMTLEEKVGQLVQYSAGQPTGPGTGRTDYGVNPQVPLAVKVSIQRLDDVHV